MSKYKSYPAYKDSAFPLLGNIPEHWELKCVKRVADVQLSNVDKHSVDGQDPVQLCNYMDVYRNEKISSDIPFMRATASAEQIRRLSLQRGDVLLTKDSEAPDDIGIPALVSEDLSDVVCGYHLAIFRPHKNKFDGGFLFRSIESLETKAYFETEAVGMTRFGLGKQSLVNTPILVPPLTEQHAIANFLDRETAKIDTLIEKQKLLIELLQEKRTALISHAVTKGLDPSTPMKDSGIPWLGEIPAHWEVKRVKHLLTEPLMYGANEAAESDDPQNPRFIRITDIDQSGNLRDDTFKSLSPDIAQPYLLKEGDILLARSGATVGKNFIYHAEWGPACFAGYLIRARFDQSKMLSGLFWYSSQTHYYWEYISGTQIQATIQNVSAEKYANLYLPCPKVVEQKAITDFLDHETTKIDTLISKARHAIELLQEHRTALISAAVTGKIDVRDAVTV